MFPSGLAGREFPFCWEIASPRSTFIKSVEKSDTHTCVQGAGPEERMLAARSAPERAEGHSAAPHWTKIDQPRKDKPSFRPLKFNFIPYSRRCVAQNTSFYGARCFWARSQRCFWHISLRRCLAERQILLLHLEKHFDFRRCLKLKPPKDSKQAKFHHKIFYLNLMIKRKKN